MLTPPVTYTSGQAVAVAVEGGDAAADDELALAVEAAVQSGELGFLDEARNDGVAVSAPSTAGATASASTSAPTRRDIGSGARRLKHSATRVTFFPAMIMPSTSSSVTSDAVGADRLAVLHHRQPVREAEHVGHVVRDQKDADAAGLELPTSSWTMRVSSGLSAAQGSSMISARALKYNAREIATTWRCPPESERTGTRMFLKFGFRR